MDNFYVHINIDKTREACIVYVVKYTKIKVTTHLSRMASTPNLVFREPIPCPIAAHMVKGNKQLCLFSAISIIGKHRTMTFEHSDHFRNETKRDMTV